MRRSAVLALTAMVTAVLVSTGPATAHGPSVYEMEGGGQMNLATGPGVPICPPDCASTTSVFTFATLPIVGTGVLAGHEVASAYNCPSSVTVVGTTASFTIDWDFTCVEIVGALPGPPTITGSFGGGYPAFTGTFTIPDHSPVSSICDGVPIPTSVSGTKITGAFFVGECTAVSP